MRQKGVLWALVILAAGTAVSVYVLNQTRPQPAASKPIATAHYLCDAGKTIDARFYAGSTTPPNAPGEPPHPGGRVVVNLSDGRTFTLAQTISADGARYSNGDPIKASETFVFWAKGNGALVFENNEQREYTGCMVVAPEPAGSDLSQAYATSSLGFSIRYPQDYTVDSSYRYREMGPGKGIAGVKFTIPASLAAGTNLGADSYLSVETLPQAKECDAGLFLEHATARTVTEDGTIYSVASTTGAGAGNRYEETVYALPGTNPCLAVRYFIHYSVFENYPAGTVTHFDHTVLVDAFDAIRHTLLIK